MYEADLDLDRDLDLDSDLEVDDDPKRDLEWEELALSRPIELLEMDRLE